MVLVLGVLLLNLLWLSNNQECVELIKSGYVHRPGLSAALREVGDRRECEAVCRGFADCRSFSFRSLSTRQEQQLLPLLRGPNCVLSADPIRDAFADLTYEVGWDAFKVFALGPDGRCVDNNRGPVGEEEPPLQQQRPAGAISFPPTFAVLENRVIYHVFLWCT